MNNERVRTGELPHDVERISLQRDVLALRALAFLYSHCAGESED